ncbi:S8 family peptidase [Saccharothrix texasensis]|uniref:Subtilase family protein n=1 Tax=Saccharothrix texasensis TaxID=103734 RepID=A0A3N1H8V3_9PSEU|nr:S8 family serine peptidase [Saccharothrix texasensis]ROP38856.1 subtilase family protein [Saccharothrix texasensis]
MTFHRAVCASAATAALLGTLLVGSASGAGPAARPLPPDRTGHENGHGTGSSERVGSTLARATGPVTAFVELSTAPAGRAYGDEKARGGQDPAAAARAARLHVDVQADQVLTALRGKDSGTREVAKTRNAVPGVVVTADAASLRGLASLPEVKSVRRTVPKSVRNAGAAELTRAARVWRDTGRYGEGMRIGIIDTGIDYTHADFGGPGTAAAYDAVDRTAPWTPTAKVVGGHDFAGDAYDSTKPEQAVPAPDPNPLDCQSHGTHVAGTAAGYGENADGTTFTGDHSALTPQDLAGMRIGPGTAPKASLYALKVFGCTGSTELVGPALDWSLDPNGDGDFGDHLDVVNLSLGGDYRGQDDPDSLFVRKVVEHGVVVVAAAGNGGDLYDVGGSPANTPEALAVANTRDAFALLDGVEVAGARQAGQYSKSYPGYAALDVTLPVVPVADPENLDGCAPITEDLNGRFVWLEWDEDDATRECGSGVRTDNAEAAGAEGVLLPAISAHFKAAIAGNAGIPVFQFTRAATDAVRPALTGGTLQVRMLGSLRNAVPTTTPTLADTITPSSSRGSRGATAAKPDVAAPGDTIVSASVGTGSDAVSMGGTSMAAPHVAGIAALVREARPEWTVEEVKAAIVNTATGDVTDGDDHTTGTPEAPMRVGAGRVDALDAVGVDLLAMVADDPGTVGVSFGPVEAASTLTVRKAVEVVNKSDRPRTAFLSYQPATTVPGATFGVWPPAVVVPPGGTASVEVALTVTPEELRKVADPTVEKVQADVARQFLAEASGRLLVRSGDRTLRVPVYAAPKPVADVAAVDRGDGTVELGGHALDQGEGDEAYRSLVSVVRLQGSSPELPDCADEVQADCAVNGSAKGGDLRYAGAGVGAGMLAFGVVTWHDWVTLGLTNSPEVRIDTTGDGVPDYAVRAGKPSVGEVVTADVWLARTVRLADGEVVDEQPLNGRYGDVDTNVMDSDVVVLPVALTALGIDPAAGSAPLTYTVVMSGSYPAPGNADGLVDRIATPMAFDPLRPGLGVEDGVTFVAEPGAVLRVRRDGSGVDGSLLLLHHHNASGDRAQVLAVR